jgi:hypothetical protein
MLYRVLQILLLGAILGAIVPVAANAQTYTFTTIDYPGAKATYPKASNVAGIVVGSYIDLKDVQHGFVYINGTFMRHDVPGAATTALTGINKNNVISGFFGNPTNHGFVLRQGTMTQIDYPGAIATEVNGIADTGNLGGTYTDSANKLHGFVSNGKGKFKKEDFPGSDYTAVNSINNSLQLTGQTSPPFISAFLFSNGQWTDFYYPNAFTTTGDGINNLGQIVGPYNPQDPTAPQQGFLRNADGTFVTISAPNGANGTVCLGINDVGVIVGTYYDSGSMSHGFIATPSH